MAVLEGVGFAFVVFDLAPSVVAGLQWAEDGEGSGLLAILFDDSGDSSAWCHYGMYIHSLHVMVFRCSKIGCGVSGVVRCWRSEHETTLHSVLLWRIGDHIWVDNRTLEIEVA